MSSNTPNSFLPASPPPLRQAARAGRTMLTRAPFQQAEKPDHPDERFLPNGTARAEPRKQQHKLTRLAFSVSRLMEFCSLRELTNQTGHGIYDWPLVVAKELIDNGLDGCEEAEVAPVITVAVQPRKGTITVEDNGPGMPEETVRAICDFSTRVSSREAYVSPSRGAQGNALKTILAMAYVLDRECRDDGDEGDAVGETVIETAATAHKIRFEVDHVTNQPRITHTRQPSPVIAGTLITIKWPRRICEGDGSHYGLLLQSKARFKALVENYAWLNPHLSLRATWEREEFVNVEATNPDWSKWRPRDPTSPHWYTEARLQRYLSAHVARDRDLGRDRPVREFVAEFRGLSGTRKRKAILAEAGVSHRSLRTFFGKDKVNRAGIGNLLAAMQRHSAPVPPQRLGIIGQEHIKTQFLAAGGAEETFKYDRRTGVTEHNIPYVVETAFGLHRSGLDEGSSAVGRKIVTGANWSVAIQNPFRTFGRTGEGLETTLAKVRANTTQPVILVLHLASAHLQYADRGKSSIVITGEPEATDV